MTGHASCLYAGIVVHKRLTPRAHAFSYRVFSMCLDVDDIDNVAERCRLFSRNRANLISFHDADHGARDGTSASDHARCTLAEAGLAEFGARIQLLCYPRLFGFVFNPLSVYFCHDHDGRLGAIIYEVSNTFAERTSYVIPVVTGVGAPNGIVGQCCAKGMSVSPFTPRHGRYGFHVRVPGEDIVVGVSLRDDAGLPLLKTHFRATRVPFSDTAIVRTVARHPLMTLKVAGAIHVQAARLWVKGVPLVTRHRSPRYTVRVVPAAPVATQAEEIPVADPATSFSLSQR